MPPSLGQGLPNATVRGVSKIADRLAELGIEPPPPFPPAANYLGCSRVGDLLFVSGHGPTAGATIVTGKVGADVSLEQGRDAARLTALVILATMRDELGDLDRVRRVIKVLGMVNAAPRFDEMPAIVDGCSDLLVEVFGDAGRHARSAVGVAELPFGIAVEIELIAEVD